MAGPTIYRCGEDAIYEKQDFNEMRFDQLASYCQRQNISYRGCNTKTSRINCIINAESKPVIYDSWTEAELRKAAGDRNLKIPAYLTANLSNKKPDVMAAREKKEADLIAILETADRNLTGFRFADLPAELRNRVYDLTLAQHAPAALERPKVPALCRVNKQIRSEALPVFYGMNHFLLRIEGTEFKVRPGRCLKVRDSCIREEDRLWLDEVVGTNARFLRKLLVGVISHKKQRDLSLTSVTVGPMKGDWDFVERGVWIPFTKNKLVQRTRMESVTPDGLGEVLQEISERRVTFCKEDVEAVLECFLDQF